MSLCDAADPHQAEVYDQQKKISTTRVSRVEDERAQLEEERRYLEVLKAYLCEAYMRRR